MWENKIVLMFSIFYFFDKQEDKNRLNVRKLFIRKWMVDIEEKLSKICKSTTKKLLKNDLKWI